MNQKTNTKKQFKTNTKSGKAQAFKQHEDCKPEVSAKHKEFLNDPQWYNRYPDLVSSTAKLAYSPVLGLPVKFNGTSQFVFPGIMHINYTPSIGVSRSGASAVNVLARKVYTFVRHANSGSANYEPADYMMYLLSIGSVYSFMASIKRLYGLLNTYSVQNRYWPKGIIESLGYDMNNLLVNKSNLRALYNQLVYKVNSLCVPKNFYYFDRCAMLQSGVYTDGPTAKPQLYLFNAINYFLFSPKTSEHGTELTLGGHMKTFQGLVEFANTMLDDLLSNEDIGIMSGDTLKAFKGEVRTVDTLDEQYSIEPVFDDYIAHQIMNSIAVGSLANGTGGRTDTRKVTQSGGFIYYTPFIETNKPTDNVSGGAMALNKLINTFHDNPTELENIEYSRLMVHSDTAPVENTGISGTAVIPISSCGTEIVLYYTGWFLDDNGSATSAGNMLNQSYSNDSTAAYLEALDIAVKSTYWDFRPFVYDISDRTPKVYGPVQNYALATGTWLQGVHDTALVSLFDVPSI